MNLRHKLFLLFMSFVVLVTNIGLNVFTHWCEEDGAFVSYVVPTNDHCGAHKEIVVLPKCCQKETQSSCSVFPAMEEQDCCSDDFSWIKLSVDQDNSLLEKGKVKSELLPFTTINECLHFQSIQKIDRTVFCTVDPPPSRRGRDILILHQVFRI